MCSKQGHSADRCFSLAKPQDFIKLEINKILVCQVCDRNGHEATNCRTIFENKYLNVDIVKG